MTTYEPSLLEVLDQEPVPATSTMSADVEYDVEGTSCRGYLAAPEMTDGPRPGVLVVHDWLGVSDTVRMRCDMLARLGYVAFAGDIYGADTRPSQAEAAGVAGSYYADLPLLRARVVAAYRELLKQPGVDPARTAAIGYCFGGSAMLQLARSAEPVGGVVSFHGGLAASPKGDTDRIRRKLLILHGSADPVTPQDQLRAFEDELLGTEGLDWQWITYSGAMHAFTIPGANSPEHGAQYDARTDRRSWAALKLFLSELFS